MFSDKAGDICTGDLFYWVKGVSRGPGEKIGRKGSSRETHRWLRKYREHCGHESREVVCQNSLCFE